MLNDMSFLEAFRQYVRTLNNPLFDGVSKALRKNLILLASEGLINLGPDHSLNGEALEIRTKQLFESMGFQVSNGRPGLEDFVLTPPAGSSVSDQVVLEIKSSRKPQIERDDLRQLDDWVFDLSGEEGARKRGLSVGVSAIITHGLGVSPRRHPSPHKGVLVFNGSINIPFDQRPQSCLSQNDVEFVNKRNFCILPLSDLISYSKVVHGKPVKLVEFWELLHSTCGLLQFSSARDA